MAMQINRICVGISISSQGIIGLVDNDFILILPLEIFAAYAKGEFTLFQHVHTTTYTSLFQYTSQYISHTLLKI